MTTHRINSHPRIGCVDQLKNSQPLLLDEIDRLLFEFVIRQSPALDPDPFVSSPKIAIETLLLADAGHIDRDDHKDSPTVERRFDLGRTGDDGLIQFVPQPESFAPKERCVVGCHHGPERV